MAKKKNLDKELEQIKRMRSINDIINRSDLENQLLYSSPTKEGEAASESITDNILNSDMNDKIINKDVKIIEDITEENEKYVKIKKQPKVRKSKVAGLKVKKVHANLKPRAKKAYANPKPKMKTKPKVKKARTTHIAKKRNK